MNAIHIIDRGPNALPIVTVDDNNGAHAVVMSYKLSRTPLVASDPTSPVQVAVMLSFMVLSRDAPIATGAANAHAGVAP